jgi:DNA (cytosine-5)-methyltransferase 1
MVTHHPDAESVNLSFSQPLMNLLKDSEKIRFIDLFCGLGGFRVAIQQVCQKKAVKSDCVFSCDIDKDAQGIYQVNFGEKPQGDIIEILADNIPNHDILMAGFPCQPFSICGDLKGFEDTRGTLFFEIVRILKVKQPLAFILENVKQLQGHQQGKTLQVILNTLQDLGYYTDYRVLNALDFGLPQKRERIFIVGFRETRNFIWPQPALSKTTLTEILEENVSDFYYASERIQKSRFLKREGKKHYSEPTIWHENKGGNVSAYPYSCALRAGASYNYLLVDGKRRLTEREMLRLQGFPDDYQIVGSYQAMRKLTGNSVAIPCVAAVVNSVLDIP